MEGVFDSLLFLAFGAVTGALAFYAYVEFSHSRLDEVVIPRVQGLSGKEASEALKRSGLKPLLTEKKCEKVIGTSPREGMIVRKGREVEVLCLGMTMDELVERMIGMPFEYVSETLMKVGLEYSVSKMPVDGEDGRVIDAEYVGGKFYLLIDSGDPPRYSRVPDVMGMDLDEAVRRIKRAGLKVKKIGNGKVVVDQSPSPGSLGFEVVLITQ